MLAAALKATKYDGVVTSCGLVDSAELNINVFPFILRGVRLIGIDSAECSMAKRLNVWSKLATEWKLDDLEQRTDEVILEQLEEKIGLILKGQLKRRVLVNLQ